MIEREIQKGDVIFQQGAISDRAFVITSGQVEIVKELDDHEVRLALLGEGEIFGEMGLVDEAPRSATARAVEKTTIKSIDYEGFIQELTQNPQECIGYLHALFERLRTMNAKVEDFESPDGFEISGDQKVKVVLKPLSDKALSAIPDAGMVVYQLPFRVGRASSGLFGRNDLHLPDQKPYNVSRNHFSIERSDKHVIVRDRGSYLGTTVNDQRIGGRSEKVVAFLKPGENEIVAGDAQSNFRFKVSLPTIPA